MIVVSLSLATICYLGQCHPALVGSGTPVGEFAIQHRMVVSPGYGGDVLAFQEDADSIMAIHRVWTQDPKQRRAERLATGSAADRKRITRGCINVTPAVYAELVDCCSGGTVKIIP